MFRTGMTVAGSLAVSAFASAETVVTFNSLAPNTILTNQVPGLSFSATNPNAGGSTQIKVWDFSGNPSAQSTGQQGPPWSGGNVPTNEDLGNGIVINGVNGGLLEGRRPAGDIFIDFAQPATRFGFTIVDVEGVEEFQTDSGFFLDFFSGGSEIGTVFFGNLITDDNPFYDGTIAFGNGTANRISPISASEFGASSFDRVEISLGGSAVVAQLRYESIPTPTAALGGLALLGGTVLRRRGQSVDA